MASRRPLRTLISTGPSALRAPQRVRRVIPETSACAFSTSAPTRDPATEIQYEAQSQARPRWQQTPARMIAPVRTRPLPKGPQFKVNDSPVKLDEMYNRMLGPDGYKVLSDEVKWLAVTHKSFDHGRRGFNDRLAFLGRRIVSLQASLALINSPQAKTTPEVDEYGRTPYTHPALAGLPGLTSEAKDSVMQIWRLAPIAQRYGLDKVTRWKPRKADDLEASGQNAVLATSLYAIVGAVALERGGEVANKIVQEKILAPMGLTFSG
ncbi:hypothetical protein M011DRAFT_481909 [Sporormia fimetaria CBS 119925]|uniref:RNase III domain-containing protein n=1 Tax=Sporormia fimetaria CBS 119925 TaxID=1340428 RepID=A0A6A6UWS5_9PLEO|nr:hypothetical protein M011DRAFT_481909 [Sporormia fimetaria CBS 119925]